MKDGKKLTEAQRLIIRLLPPEEYGEDSNVEELYNRVTNMGSELEQARKEIAELKEKISNMYAEQYGSADWIEMRMRETWERACKAQRLADNEEAVSFRFEKPLVEYQS